MSEEKKQGLPVNGGEPDFDENCQFLEDIQKKDALSEEIPEDYVDLEKTNIEEKKHSRLERLAERQSRHEARAEESREPKERPTEPAAVSAVAEEAPKEEHRVPAEEPIREDRGRFTAVRTKVFQMVEVGFDESGITRAYDYLNLFTILLNVTATVLFTFDYFENNYGNILHWVEAVTVAFFALDYVLRIWTAPLLHPQDRSATGVRKYIFSFWGLIDLISFLPYYIPFFPDGGATFRLFRVVRIFRLFRVNKYSDSLGAITSVLKSKKQQLLSSVFIILVLMLASSLCLYSVEHDAQPEVFRNALSGIWWASSALLTVGYGDMYPITIAGKIMAMIITFLGVGLVAIPTGIISAGFVEQFQKIRESEEEAGEVDFHFIKVQLNYKDEWVGMKIMDLNLPHNVVVAVILRGKSTIVPRGDVVLQEGDTLVLGAESAHDKEWDLDLKEIVLKRKHPWNGQFIRDLDISRQTFIVLVRRKNRSMVPNGNLMLKEGDEVVLYSKKHIADAVDIEL